MPPLAKPSGAPAVSKKPRISAGLRQASDSLARIDPPRFGVSSLDAVRLPIAQIEGADELIPRLTLAPDENGGSSGEPLARM